MKKKLLSVVLSTAMLASVLAGCGGNDGGGSSVNRCSCSRRSSG